MAKYRNAPTYVDDIRFASKAEAERYIQLKQLQTAGEIYNLELQPRYPVAVNGNKICTYVADFRYIDKGAVGRAGQAGCTIVEDVKGVLTPIYRLKKKLVEAVYPGVKIEEIKITKRQYVK